MDENSTRRVELSDAQAAILRAINERKQAVEREFAQAVTLVGIDPATVVSGELGDAPHFVVRDG